MPLSVLSATFAGSYLIRRIHQTQYEWVSSCCKGQDVENHTVQGLLRADAYVCLVFPFHFTRPGTPVITRSVLASIHSFARLLSCGRARCFVVKRHGSYAPQLPRKEEKRVLLLVPHSWMEQGIEVQAPPHAKKMRHPLYRPFRTRYEY